MGRWGRQTNIHRSRYEQAKKERKKERISTTPPHLHTDIYIYIYIYIYIERERETETDRQTDREW